MRGLLPGLILSLLAAEQSPRVAPRADRARYVPFAPSLPPTQVNGTSIPAELRARRMENARRNFATGHWQRPVRAEEGREYHQDGTVVINYRDGGYEEFPPACRHLVPR